MPPEKSQEPKPAPPDDAKRALLLLLDQIDYTRGACRVNEMIGALVTPEILDVCRAAVR